jgi:hypothetical protein
MATSSLVAEVLAVFRQIHGDVPFTLQFVAEVAISPNASFNGVCDFNQTPPEISIRTGLGETELLDVLFHELAHLVCGMDAGHGQSWEDCHNELSISFGARSFNRLNL